MGVRSRHDSPAGVVTTTQDPRDMMTAISTSLGILPIALALGAGAESRVPMGIAVIGGLVIGTLFTLFVIPAVYTFISRGSAPHASEKRVVESAPESEEQPAYA